MRGRDGMTGSPFPPEMNQPQWLPVALKEIEQRAWKLMFWEWMALGPIRKKIHLGHKLEPWEQERLFKIHKYSGLRKTRPPEEDKPNKPKPRKDFYV